MSLYILDHANGKFVSGLFWQVLSRPREAKAEAKELGESMSFDFLLVRSAGSVMQAGFCARTDGATEDMTSIAALIARAVESNENAEPPLNWAAAVALPSGEYAYAAVRDGAFLPEGDLAGSKDDIINRMASDFSLGDWELVICPAEFGFPNSQEKTFDDFLVLDKKGRHKPIPSTVIEPVKRKLPWKKLGAIGAVVAVLGSGAYAYQSYQAKIEAERQAALMAEQQARMEAEAAAKRNAVPAWVTLPESLAMIKACEEAFFNLTLNPAGWVFEGGSCERDGSVKSGFKRDPLASGTVIELKKEFGSKVRIDWSGDVAIHDNTVVLPKGRKDPLLGANEIVEKFVGTAQQMELKVAVREAAGGGAAAAPVPGQMPGAGTPPGVGMLVFEARANIQPSMYERVFGLPGVRPKSVKVTPGGEWTVEGEIYVEKK